MCICVMCVCVYITVVFQAITHSRVSRISRGQCSNGIYIPDKRPCGLKWRVMLKQPWALTQDTTACVSSPPSSPTPPHPTLLSLSGCYQLYFSLLFFLDNHGARNKLALVQYMFNGPEIEVISKPHGNSKGSTPYFRTSDSARQKLQTLVATQTPKTVIETVTREAGGELNIENPSDAP